MTHEQREEFHKYVKKSDVPLFESLMFEKVSVYQFHKSKTQYYHNTDVLFAAFNGFDFTGQDTYDEQTLIRFGTNWIKHCFEMNYIINISYKSFHAAIRMLWGYRIKQPTTYTPSDDLKDMLIISKALDAAIQQGVWDGKVTADNYSSLTEFSCKALTRFYKNETIAEIEKEVDVDIPVEVPEVKVVEPTEEQKATLAKNINIKENKSMPKGSDTILPAAIKIMRKSSNCGMYSQAFSMLIDIVPMLADRLCDQNLKDLLGKLDKTVHSIRESRGFASNIHDYEDVLAPPKPDPMMEAEIVSVKEPNAKPKRSYTRIKDGTAAVSDTYRITFNSSTSRDIIKSGLRNYSLMSSKDRSKVYLVLSNSEVCSGSIVTSGSNCRICNRSVVKYITDFFHESKEYFSVVFGDIKLVNDSIYIELKSTE